MIHQNSIGYDAQIKNLLLKSCLNMSKEEIHAWMKHEYDPEHMFCFWQDGQITSCLQVHERNLNFLDHQFRVSVIALWATLPDYRQRKQFSSLLDAALMQATYNDLLTLTYTNMPKLFDTKSFQTITSTKEYWIGSGLCRQGDFLKVKQSSKNLYPLYFQFMQYFDGSIILSEEEFSKKILYAKEAGKTIVTMYNEHKEEKGFAIYTSQDNQAHVETLIYFDSQSIQDLLTYLSTQHEVTSLLVSENERLDKLFPLHFPRLQGKVLVRLNNYKLFNKLMNTDVRNAQSAFQQIEKPIWNHFQ